MWNKLKKWWEFQKYGFDSDALSELKADDITPQAVMHLYHESEKYAIELLERGVAHGNFRKVNGKYQLIRPTDPDFNPSWIDNP